MNRTALLSRLPGLLLLGVAGYYVVWGGEYSAFDLRELASRRGSRTQELDAVRKHVDSLRHVATALETRDTAIERIARERFGMIREGELLFRFVEVGDDAGGAVMARK